MGSEKPKFKIERKFTGRDDAPLKALVSKLLRLVPEREKPAKKAA